TVHSTIMTRILHNAGSSRVCQPRFRCHLIAVDGLFPRKHAAELNRDLERPNPSEMPENPLASPGPQVASSAIEIDLAPAKVRGRLRSASHSMPQAALLAGPRVDVLPEDPAAVVHAIDRHQGRDSVAERVE